MFSYVFCLILLIMLILSRTCFVDMIYKINKICKMNPVP